MAFFVMLFFVFSQEEFSGQPAKTPSKTFILFTIILYNNPVDSIEKFTGLLYN